MQSEADRAHGRTKAKSKKLAGCAILGLLAVLLIVALNSVSSDGNSSEPANSPGTEPRPAGYVSAAMLQSKGDAWPLSVPEAVVGCDKGMLLWVEVNGTRYGLNGSATSMGYPDFRPFWLFDKDYIKQGERPVDGHTPRINIQPLFERAQRFC